MSAINPGSIIPAILGELSAAERWNAARRTPSNSNYYPWLVGIGLIIVVVLAITLLARVVARVRKSQNAWKAFYETAEYEGLTTEELELAKTLVAHSFIENEYDTFFTLESAFNDGVSNYLHSEKFSEFEAVERNEVNTLIGSLREKLGMRVYADNDAKRGSRMIGESVKVKLIRQGSGEAFTSIVEQVTEDDIQISPLGEHASEIAADCKPGTVWMMRYFDGQSLWEFDTPILNHENGRISLAHSDAARIVNRRRFARVEVSFPAKICLFNFSYPGEKLDKPTWHEAKLTQLAGPGLKLRASKLVAPDLKFRTAIDAKKGKQVLVISQIRENRIVQAMGRIRRVESSGAAFKNVVVELVNLTRKEIAELSSATNFAASQLKRKQQNEIRELAQAPTAAQQHKHAETENVEAGGTMDVA